MPIPVEEKRQAQFMELYRHYSKDWSKSALHFQLEEFFQAVVFHDYKYIAMESFLTYNEIHISMHPDY